MDLRDRHLVVFRILDGLRAGLTRFSGPSRTALLIAQRRGDPITVYDPQALLRPHEHQIRRLLVHSTTRVDSAADTANWNRVGMSLNLGGLPIPGLISFGSRSNSAFYLMIFSDRHSNMCCTGPTERWLQEAAWTLSHDLAMPFGLFSDALRNSLEWYAPYAVEHHLASKLEKLKANLPVRQIIYFLQELSSTLEEGTRPSGRLAFTAPSLLSAVAIDLRFGDGELPSLEHPKHIGKLLHVVKGTHDLLVSDGVRVVGITRGKPPPSSIEVEFERGQAEIRLGKELVCTMRDGRFSSQRSTPDLRPVEDVLHALGVDRARRGAFVGAVSWLVSEARKRRHGCTLVIDLGRPPHALSGQRLQRPMPLDTPRARASAAGMAKVDGALHLDGQARVLAFACLLDGPALAAEDRSRGARYNSAARFTAANDRAIVVTVSEDGPLSVFAHGCCVSTPRSWPPIDRINMDPPTLDDWLATKSGVPAGPQWKNTQREQRRGREERAGRTKRREGSGRGAALPRGDRQGQAARRASRSPSRGSQGRGK